MCEVKQKAKIIPSADLDKSLWETLENLYESMDYHGLIVIGVRERLEGESSKQPSRVDVYKRGCRSCMCDGLAAMLGELDSEELLYVFQQMESVEAVNSVKKKQSMIH